MSQSQLQHIADIAALQFYIDAGVLNVSGEEVVDRYALKTETPPGPNSAPDLPMSQMARQSAQAASTVVAPPSMGAAEGRAEAVKLAQEAGTLEELQKAISDFDGLAVKKTATQLVFADGNPEAPIMLIGEAPGADEDRQGKPFVGAAGQLLDKIFASIGLDRACEDASKSVYISNILNWRPPGNRTPTPAEVEISLPFIERHIQIVKPKLIILCGGVSAKALLGSDQSISRLRKSWHDYVPQTEELKGAATSIPAIATYHPAYLLRTPAQKKAVWADMLEIKGKLEAL